MGRSAGPEPLSRCIESLMFATGIALKRVTSEAGTLRRRLRTWKPEGMVAPTPKTT
jgi:hypothetical protein